MSKLGLIVSGIVLCPIVAAAQEVPRHEVFAGYSYLRGRGASVPSRADQNVDMHGWNVSIATNFTDWFAIVADFSGHYGEHHFRVFSPAGRFGSDTTKNIHLFLVGPRFSPQKTRRFSPYVQSLFGIARANTIARDSVDSSTTFKLSNTDVGFAAAFGVGLDARLTQRLTLRLVQVDYILTRLDGNNGLTQTKENLRVSAGASFRFGR